MFLILQTTNASFIAQDRGSDYVGLAQARAAAIESCLQIALQEIRQGKSASSVEALLKDLDGQVHDRLVASISVAPLLVPGGRKE